MASLGISGPQKTARLHRGPKGVRSTTWCLYKVRLRFGDHYPVVTLIEVRELKGTLVRKRQLCKEGP